MPRSVYAENIGHLANVFDQVQASLWAAHTKQASHYNLRRKAAEYDVGDVVWKKTFYQSDKDKYFSKKLAPKFVKCRVQRKRSPLVYDLVDMAGKDIGTWHIKDLKLTFDKT